MKNESINVNAAGKLDGYILAILRNDFFKSGVFDPQTLRVFNRYMLIPIALAALYLILDAIIVNPSRNAVSTISRISTPRSGTLSLPERSTRPEIIDYSRYSNMLSGKNIFGAGSSAQTEAQDIVDEPSSNDVGLVGIVAGDNPQAIIEDKKAQKTYYLNKGQSINGITVEEISEGQVILNYRGRRMTLLL